MRIVVNGEPREIAAGTTVAQLLVELGVKGERVAVEVNLDVVRREARDARALAEDDQVEIVSFVGGGA
jgi:sulfur carrier protein